MNNFYLTYQYFDDTMELSKHCYKTSFFIKVFDSIENCWIKTTNKSNWFDNTTTKKKKKRTKRRKKQKEFQHFAIHFEHYVQIVVLNITVIKNRLNEFAICIGSIIQADTWMKFRRLLEFLGTKIVSVCLIKSLFCKFRGNVN